MVPANLYYRFNSIYQFISEKGYICGVYGVYFQPDSIRAFLRHGDTATQFSLILRVELPH